MRKSIVYKIVKKDSYIFICKLEKIIKLLNIVNKELFYDMKVEIGIYLNQILDNCHSYYILVCRLLGYIRSNSNFIYKKLTN